MKKNNAIKTRRVMLFRFCTAIWGLIFLLAAPGIAAAAGNITGLSVSPSPAYRGQPVTATVSGTGSCNKVVIVWEGDGSASGTKDTLKPPPPFPVSLQHTYGHTGTVTVRARGGANSTCTGTEQVQLVIEPGLEAGEAEDYVARLCNVIECGSMVAGRIDSPTRHVIKLAQIEGGFGSLRTGSPLLLYGKDFGDVPGWVIIDSYEGPLYLKVQQWGDTGIGGVVPDLAGKCINGKIRVQRADSVLGDWWEASVPTVIKQLPRQDIQVLACGDDGNQNYCNEVSHKGDMCFFTDPEYDSMFGAQTTIRGSHSNCGGATENDTGTDSYRTVTLDYRWDLYNAVLMSNYEHDEKWTSPPAGQLSVSGQKWEGSINWTVTPGDMLVYLIDIDIAGRECWPHK